MLYFVEGKGGVMIDQDQLADISANHHNTVLSTCYDLDAKYTPKTMRGVMTVKLSGDLALCDISLGSLWSQKILGSNGKYFIKINI